MVNMKYYLILLISVFLSLGTGTVVGISIQNKEVLEKQHSVLVNRLEEEFNDIRDENKELKEELNSVKESEAHNKEIYRMICDSIIREKLNGLKVALVEIGDEEDFSWISSLLKMSGASLEAGITLNRELFQADEILNTEIIKSLGLEEMDIDLYEIMAEGLAKGIAMGRYNSCFRVLKEFNLIDSSVKVQEGCDVMVLGYNDSLDHKGDIRAEFCEYLLNKMGDYPIPVIMVEMESSKGMDIDRYKAMGISTIDHVDTLYGRLTLVSLLTGDKGNFGLRDGTKGPIPDILFPSDEESRDSIDTAEDEE